MHLTLPICQLSQSPASELHKNIEEADLIRVLCHRDYTSVYGRRGDSESV